MKSEFMTGTWKCQNFNSARTVGAILGTLKKYDACFYSFSASFFYLLCAKNRLSLDSLFIISSNLSCINTKQLNFQLETVWACSCRLLQGEELQLVREALRSLRDSFSGHDPQHHTLDTLEQGVSSLMDRLHSLDSQRRQDRGVHMLSHPHSRHLLSESPTHVTWLFTVCDCSPLQEEFKSPGRRANSTDRDSWPPSSSETDKKNPCSL